MASNTPAAQAGTTFPRPETDAPGPLDWIKDLPERERSNLFLKWVLTNLRAPRTCGPAGGYRVQSNFELSDSGRSAVRPVEFVPMTWEQACASYEAGCRIFQKFMEAFGLEGKPDLRLWVVRVAVARADENMLQHLISDRDPSVRWLAFTSADEMDDLIPSRDHLEAIYEATRWGKAFCAGQAEIPEGFEPPIWGPVDRTGH
jgi:hypothetical protein